MLIEYIFEDKTEKLSPESQADVVSQICANFESWNSARQSQLEDAKLIRESIYNCNKNSRNSWKSEIKLPEIYELAQTLKAHLWENIYNNPSAMFDVSGKTPEAQEYANKQKAMLVNAFEEMDITPELDKAIDDLIEVGDCVLFIGWETRYKFIRRAKSLSEKVSDVINGSASIKTKYVIEQKPVFDGVKVRAISPENFVFDASRKDDWDNCPKIYKTYSTFEAIASNKTYTLSPEAYERLSTMVTESKNKGYSGDEGVRNGQIEILEFWGDFKLDNGQVLKNWLITVAGRSEVIRFEANPYVINPFICTSLLQDPETKRGISPLKIALVINNISSDILNRQLDALSLITNPPYLAPKGCFNGKQEVSPGSIIEYDSALMTQLPTPLRFESALQGWEFIDFFKQTLESSTGIFKNMVGTTESTKRTATEITYTVGGQSTRLNMAVDNITQRLIIPMVERVADLIANFKFGKETIPLIERGKANYIEIDDAIRQADYKYTYGDRRASQERKLRFRELFDVISSFAKIESVAQQVDWLKCFKYALEQYGIENPDSFLKEINH